MKRFLSANGVFSIKYFPVLLLFFVFLVYGYQFTRMGIYWDDWQAILLSNLKVPNAFWDYYLFDRPFSIWTYILPLPLLKNYPALWQIYGILARWFAALGLWVFLHGMFPSRKQEAGWITLLWSVYPGFFSQSVSIAYCQHFVTCGLFNFSLAAMIWSIRQKRQQTLLTFLGAASSLVSMLTMEYFVGLEILRPVILYLTADKVQIQGKKRISYVIRKWLPYLAAVLIFVLCRFWLTDRLNGGQTGNRPEFLLGIFSQPLQTLVTFAQMMIQDTVYLLFTAWGSTVTSAEIDFSSNTYLFSILIGALISGLFFFIASKWKKVDEDTNDGFFRNALILGMLAFFFGGIPVWAIGRQVTVGMWSDRFALAPMLGVCILVVLFWEWISAKNKISSAILGIILAVSISFQIRSVNNFQNNWLQQERFYWQVMWRAPSIAQGTSILSPTMPFGLVAEYSIWYAFNAIYDQNLDSTQMDYAYLSALRHRYYQISDFKEDGSIYAELRSLTFNGSTSDALVFYEAPKQRCIWFVNPDDAYLPGLDSETSALFSISHPERISNVQGTNTQTVSQIFGEESNHNWCYFYQKAELAAQFADWSAVENLKSEADSVGEEPEHGRELFPFIQAYAHLDQWENVKTYSEQAISLTEDLQERTCLFLRDVADETQNTSEPEQKQAVLTELEQSFNCEAYAQ
jgi:hypothetical protein